MPDQAHINQLIHNHERRLQKLKERAALGGINTDPVVEIEIEDIEAELERLRGGKPATNTKTSTEPSPASGDAPPSVSIHWPQTLEPKEAHYQQIVPQLFIGKKEVYIEKEIGGGLGGARLFLVQPLNRQGRRTARQIIKIGYKRELRAEYENTKQHIEQDLPLAGARLEHYVEWEQWAGLAYSFVGDGGLGKTQTFEAYYQAASAEQIIATLTRLLDKSLGHIWYAQHQPHNCTLADEYGRHLAEHLRVKVRRTSTDAVWLADQSPSANTHYHHLVGKEIVAEHQNFQPGDLVQIERLKIVKCKHEELKLQYADQPGVVVKIEGPYPETWAVGDEIGVRGEVVYNRHGWLVEVVEQLFAHFPEAEVDVQQEQFTWNGKPYPNPLKLYPQILDRLLTSRKSTVHGDLHVRNILVDDDGRGWLIDFAKVSERHNLFDFIKLEVYLRRMVLSQFDLPFAAYLAFEEALAVTSLGGSATPPDHPELQKAYQVILALREIATHYMGHPPNFHGEYFPALFLYSVAMLKYYAPHEVAGLRLMVGGMGVVGGQIEGTPKLPPPPPSEPPGCNSDSDEGTMEELKQKMEKLKKVLKQLQLNLDLIQEDIMVFGLGMVPLNLRLQEMNLKEKIEETEAQIHQIQKSINNLK